MSTEEAWHPYSIALPLTHAGPGDRGESQKERSIKNTRASWEGAWRGGVRSVAQPQGWLFQGSPFQEKSSSCTPRARAPSCRDIIPQYDVYQD